jgi:hypothetical protein
MRGFVRLGAMPAIVSTPNKPADSSATTPTTDPVQTAPTPLPPEDDDVILDEEGQPTRSEDGAMLRSE